MHAEKSAWSIATMACSCSPTRTHISLARSRSMFIRFVSPRVNSGVSRRRRTMRCMLIYGTTTLSQPEPQPDAVFAEPWQAQAFALAVELSGRGCFTWKEWSAALAEELALAASRGERDDGSRYYDHWLAALERLVTAKGLMDPVAL